MKRLSFLFVLLTCSYLPAQDTPTLPKPKDPARWEKEIAAIETRLKQDPPAPGGIVFTGSSSIRLWDLKKYFPGLPLINAGFGGSMIPDATHFAPRLVLPLKPRMVVFYSGDNDASAGHPATRIAEDFKAFATTIHAALPDCRIVYIPIKPSVARWKLLELQTEANNLIGKLCASQAGKVEYIELATPLLTPHGTLRPELYQKDGLHLGPAGYEIWSRLLRPYLEKP